MGDVEPAVERLLRDCLRERAEHAPLAGQLLGEVHHRSRRIRRQRMITTATAAVAAALVAVAVPSAVAAIGRGGAGHPAGSPAPSGTATVEPSGSSAPSPTRGSSQPPSAGVAVSLAPPAYPAPSFPYRMGTMASRFAAPVATLDSGALAAYYEARDPVGDADVTIVVTGQRPQFAAPPPGVSATEVARQVRGHAGTLRTVAVAPAAQLTLYWPESASRWVQVVTDDTYTDSQVVQFAEHLVAATLPVVAPFRLDLAPAGMLLDTSLPGTMAFRPSQVPAEAPASAKLVCTLLTLRAPTGTAVTVGGYRGAITRTDGGATLMVALDDWDMTLVVQVPARYPITNADLIRFAAGLHPTDRAEPASTGR